MSDVELKHCPFCGGEAAIRKWQDEDLWSHSIVEWQRVHCTECECEGMPTCEGYEQNSVEVWNLRPALAEPEGYVLVPVEPTEAMLQAAAFGVAGKTGQTFKPMMTAGYAAMLAARPEVPRG